MKVEHKYFECNLSSGCRMESPCTYCVRGTGWEPCASPEREIARLMSGQMWFESGRVERRRRVVENVIGRNTRDLGIWGCIEKFPDWPPGARTANGTALCHWMQLYRYSVSQSSEFCRRNPLCCFTTSVYCCKRIFRYRFSLETFEYILIRLLSGQMWFFESGRVERRSD
jgi:hypothetical protein